MSAVIAALAISGCGSSNSDTASNETAGGETLTKSQFIKQANAICQKGLEEKDDAVRSALKQLPADTRENPTPQAFADLAEETVLPSYGKITKQLSELGVPAGEEAQVEKIVQQFESALQSAEAEPANVAKENLFVSADKAAQAYGLELCSL